MWSPVQGGPKRYLDLPLLEPDTRWRSQCGGCGHSAANLSEFILSQEINCGTWKHTIAPRSQSSRVMPWIIIEKSRHSPLPPVYNLRIITKIEWLFVEINLHKTFLSDKVILWPWKRTRPRSLSRTPKKPILHINTEFLHKLGLFCLMFCIRDVTLW